MKMLKKISLVAALLLVVSVISTTASADEAKGFYGVAQAVYSSFDASGGLSDSVSLNDEEDFGFGVLAGYQINPFVGVEAGWIDLGEAQGMGTDGEQVPVRVDPGASGVHTQVVGTYPLLDWLALNGNIGAFFWDTTTRSQAVSQVVLENDDGVGLSLGAGAQVQVHKNIALRLGYTRFFGVGDLDIDSIMLSAVFHSWDAD